MQDQHHISTDQIYGGEADRTSDLDSLQEFTRQRFEVNMLIPV